MVVVFFTVLSTAAVATAVANTHEDGLALGDGKIQDSARVRLMVCIMFAVLADIRIVM